MSDLLDFSPPGQATFSLAGAKARFYDAGTTTPRTVYADEAETVPHPSPLLADSNGRFAQAFVSGGAVKVVVTQSDDSTGYTLDPCTKVSATGSAASAVSFTPSVLRPQTTVQEAIDEGTFPNRTMTGTAGLIAVTNGNGVSGNPTFTIANGTEGQLLRAGSSAPAWGSAINRGTAVASTSGTAIDFTGIPSWARRVTMMLQGVSTNGTSAPLVQIGPVAGVATSGYSGSTGDISGAATSLASTGFQIGTAISAAGFLNGSLVIENMTWNVWVARGTFARADGAQVYVTAGSVSLSGALERIRLTTVGGVNTFDAGSVNIFWE